MRDVTRWRKPSVQSVQPQQVIQNGDLNGNGQMLQNGQLLEQKQGFLSKLGAAPGRMIGALTAEPFDEPVQQIPQEQFNHLVDVFEDGVVFTNHGQRPAMAEYYYSEIWDAVAKNVTPLMRDVRSETNQQFMEISEQVARVSG